MPDNVSFSKTIFALERAIDIAQQRHTNITSNISNLDTPNYKAKEIDFKRALAQALESDNGFNLAKTHEGHIDMGANASGRIEPFEEEGEWNGFNWVGIDREMEKLMENNLTYRTAIESLLRRLNTLKEVIREGGR
ncbi:MAG: flagellar basal body rod protein FlgB [Deltaproteobacteria bacterium]|nr:flagellar basal body rod protein FlgB [Deltaproteobacteria bacterium]MBW2340088.1 flagellar basal body rod protein FlgB [Deltaproteobacteria bacterium]